MTSKGIAQRLIAKHGPRYARTAVKAQLRMNRFYWEINAPASSRVAAKLGAYRMFWTAVLHHLEQGT